MFLSFCASFAVFVLLYTVAVRAKWSNAIPSDQISPLRGNENGEEQRSKPAPHLHCHPPPRRSRFLRSRRLNPVLSLHRWARDGSNRNLIPRIHLICLSNLAFFLQGTRTSVADSEEIRILSDFQSTVQQCVVRHIYFWETIFLLQNDICTWFRWTNNISWFWIRCQIWM